MCFFVKEGRTLNLDGSNLSCHITIKRTFRQISQVMFWREAWEGEIRDYKTACPELVLTCPGYFGGEGVGTICIPIKYCPECGRKLGKEENSGE